MSILSKIFSSGANELVKGVGGVIDDLSTSDEERLEAKRKIKEAVLNYEKAIQVEVSDRWRVDMQSDSWLSKNIRPMVLIFLCVSTVLLIFIDAGFLDFVVDNSWIDLLKVVLMTCIGAYFGGRSFEKVKK
jgi:hypothetical protein|tara:strand:- start:775 stop:1167 length:393 start_codon:yes stop_codon:yes gene_type:complete